MNTQYFSSCILYDQLAKEGAAQWTYWKKTHQTFYLYVFIMQTTSKWHLHFNPPYVAFILNRLKKLE